MYEVFVSYSSEDKDVAWQLIAALRRSGCNVWDYTRVGDGIPYGSNIREHLRTRIAEANAFLPLISSHTAQDTRGAWTQFEAACATERVQANRNYLIIPIVIRPVAPSLFSGAHAPFGKMFYLELETNDDGAAERAVKRLCPDINVRYVPPLINHAILLRNRFFAELHVHISEGTHISVAQRLELEEIVAFFEEASSQAHPNWETIVEAACAFVHKTRREHLGSWYYPVIMRGLAELELGDLASAERSFRVASAHAMCDEHAFGGLGFVHYRRGETAEGIRNLREALKRAKHNSWELQLNILLVLHEAGEPVDVEPILQGIDLQPLQAADWVKVMNLRGVCFCDRSMFTDAERILTQVWNLTDNGIPLANDVTAIYLSRALAGLRRTDDAITILRNAAVRFQDANVYHHLASLLWDCGKPMESLQVYDKLMHPKFRRRRFAIGYARRLRAARYPDRMAAVCREVLDTAVYGIPQSPEDFWFCGFAHYLLGDTSLSEYERNRGSAYSRTRYENIEP